jgi:hypothetical protein
MDERRKFDDIKIKIIITIVIIKRRLSISSMSSMTAENGALGQGLGQGNGRGLVLAVARFGTAGSYNWRMDSRVLGCDMPGWLAGLWYGRCAQHHPERKTSRLRASVGDRLLVGLVNPAEGGNDARAVPKIRDRKDVDVPFRSTMVPMLCANFC